MPVVKGCVYVLPASRLPSRRKAEVSAPVAESSEARQKFANAKAISSDIFFGRESSADVRNLGHNLIEFDLLIHLFIMAIHRRPVSDMKWIHLSLGGFIMINPIIPTSKASHA